MCLCEGSLDRDHSINMTSSEQEQEQGTGCRAFIRIRGLTEKFYLFSSLSPSFLSHIFSLLSLLPLSSLLYSFSSHLSSLSPLLFLLHYSLPSTIYRPLSALPSGSISFKLRLTFLSSPFLPSLTLSYPLLPSPTLSYPLLPSLTLSYPPLSSLPYSLFLSPMIPLYQNSITTVVFGVSACLIC